MNPFETELVDWAWWQDPIFWIVVLIIAVGAWRGGCGLGEPLMTRRAGDEAGV